MNIFTKAAAWLRRPFPATSAFARLGIIAATFCGCALAFHLGGRDGYALPLTALLGAPANTIVLRILRLIRPIPPNALWSGADWNVYLLLFSACVALNWTLVGLAADLVGRRPPSRGESLVNVDEMPALTDADFDPLAREFEHLERKVREPAHPTDDPALRRAA